MTRAPSQSIGFRTFLQRIRNWFQSFKAHRDLEGSGLAEHIGGAKQWKTQSYENSADALFLSYQGRDIRMTIPFDMVRVNGSTMVFWNAAHPSTRLSLGAGQTTRFEGYEFELSS